MAAIKKIKKIKQTSLGNINLKTKVGLNMKLYKWKRGSSIAYNCTFSKASLHFSCLKIISLIQHSFIKNDIKKYLFRQSSLGHAWKISLNDTFNQMQAHSFKHTLPVNLVVVLMSLVLFVSFDEERSAFRKVG